MFKKNNFKNCHLDCYLKNEDFVVEVYNKYKPLKTIKKYKIKKIFLKELSENCQLFLEILKD